MLDPCVRRASQDNMRSMEFYTPYSQDTIVCFRALDSVSLFLLQSPSLAICWCKRALEKVTSSILLLRKVLMAVIYSQVTEVKLNDV
jgi:hypothetical protein